MDDLDTPPSPSSDDAPRLPELVCDCGARLRYATAWTAIQCGTCATVLRLTIDRRGFAVWRAT